MKYEEQLIKEIKNPDAYLGHQDSWILSELDGMANDILHQSKGIESKIASLFIYHQLTEEILAMLFRFCDLVIRASLFPIIFNEPIQKTQKGFSKNLELLKTSIDFKDKSNLISAAIQLNNIRNRIGHRLITDFKDFNLDEELTEIDKLFKKIFEHRTEGLKWFYQQLNQLKERENIKGLLDKY